MTSRAVARLMIDMPEVSANAATGTDLGPDCAGLRPHSESVRRYHPEAADGAGSHVCPQCGPYRSSMLDVDGSRELVCQGVRLILDGALDDGSEDRLGERLGVSGRHLRRLFLAHLGITPSGLAVSSRAHFARRLLDDTDLPFTDIAYAAGFGSVRQFNRVMQSVFKRAPREMRLKRVGQGLLVADEGLPLCLPVSGAIDWDGTLTLLAAASIPGMESVDGRTYRRVVVVQEAVGMLEVLPADAEHLLVKVHLPHWGPLIHLVQQVRQMLRLDSNPEEPSTFLSRDSLIGHLVRQRSALRPAGAWDSFEAGVKAICGAPGDLEAGNRLAQVCCPIEGNWATLQRFGLRSTLPSPNALATLESRGHSLPPWVATPLVSLAVAVLEGTATIDADVPMHVRVRSFGSLDGVRPPMAERFAWLVGAADALPGEAHWRAAGLGLTQPLARGDFEAVAEHWHPYAAFAYAHLLVRVGPIGPDRHSGEQRASDQQDVRL